MSHSEAWADIQPPNLDSIHRKSHTDTNVIDIITDMLDVAKTQSELSQSMIPFFFSRINNILDHLVQIGKIKSYTQSLYFRRKIMEKLDIPQVDIHIELLDFFGKNPIYKDRFTTSLQSIQASVRLGTSYDDAIKSTWRSRDKQYFDRALTNFVNYKKLIGGFYIEKYGIVPSKK